MGFWCQFLVPPYNTCKTFFQLCLRGWVILYILPCIFQFLQIYFFISLIFFSTNLHFPTSLCHIINLAIQIFISSLLGAGLKFTLIHQVTGLLRSFHSPQGPLQMLMAWLCLKLCLHFCDLGTPWPAAPLLLINLIFIFYILSPSTKIIRLISIVNTIWKYITQTDATDQRFPSGTPWMVWGVQTYWTPGNHESQVRLYDLTLGWLPLVTSSFLSFPQHAMWIETFAFCIWTDKGLET